MAEFEARKHPELRLRSSGQLGLSIRKNELRPLFRRLRMSELILNFSTAGRSIPVVRVHGVDLDRVQFPAARYEK